MHLRPAAAGARSSCDDALLTNWMIKDTACHLLGAMGVGVCQQRPPLSLVGIEYRGQRGL
jgi:hypothetical protein